MALALDQRVDLELVALVLLAVVVATSLGFFQIGRDVHVGVRMAKHRLVLLLAIGFMRVQDDVLGGLGSHVVLSV